ncbi:zinc metalloprotease [Limnohabitans sp. MORI2]|uniref:RIP metalloprotease RseP n=1 Tax=Limnohabitans sp. MORI2 TaxID=1751150 RepID=UPI0023771184|nr:RIP metalloprotease RseP [Limnohabitans sp. MORI2]BDU58483.1 zinc metalloprotease [Limnohabitans sp. MORI2]
MTLLTFLLALGVLITVHEWGHYRVAVACGVKVLTFSIGFGKPLLRWKSRRSHLGQETEFCIGWIPLGGFVKMLDENEGEVAAKDLPMAFNRQPLWARASIVLAGPLANLLLAVCLYAAMFGIGQYQTSATLAAPVVGSVADIAGLQSGDTVLRLGTHADDLDEVTSLENMRWQLLQQAESAVYLEVKSLGKQTPHVLHLPELPSGVITKEANAWQARGLTVAWSRALVGEIQPHSPAQKAGLQHGDEVLRIDGKVVIDAYALRSIVRQSGSEEEPPWQMWEIARGGRYLTLNVRPERVFEGSQHFGRIGAQVGEPPAQVWVQSDAFDSISRALSQTRQVITMTLEMLGRLITGQASLDNLSGPLTMADYAGRSANLGMSAFLGYLALVSISLGVFNLLPLPVLDGGHLLYYLYEACTGHPPSPDWLDALQRVGLVVLVTLMVFSLFNDMVRLGWLL